MRKQIAEHGSDDSTDAGQKAYKGIRRMLYHKRLFPGQKVPCRQVADELRMSPTPIIQALKWLEFQGFVRHEPHRGYYLQPLRLAEVQEIYELREILEPALIPAVVGNLDQDGLTRLQTAMQAHLSAGRSGYPKKRLFKNTEFHLTLATLSGKQTQIRVLRNVLDILLLKYGGSELNTGSVDTSGRDHQEIFTAVAERDVSAAQALLTRHLTTVREEAVENFRRLLEETDLPEFM